MKLITKSDEQGSVRREAKRLISRASWPTKWSATEWTSPSFFNLCRKKNWNFLFSGNWWSCQYSLTLCRSWFLFSFSRSRVGNFRVNEVAWVAARVFLLWMERWMRDPAPWGARSCHAPFPRTYHTVLLSYLPDHETDQPLRGKTDR